MNIATLDQQLNRFMLLLRKLNTAVAAMAFVSYGLAYYVWTLGQTMGAFVIATMGYLLFRSLRTISFNLAWQHCKDKPEYAELLPHLDLELVKQGEQAIKKHLDKTLNED